MRMERGGVQALGGVAAAVLATVLAAGSATAQIATIGAGALLSGRDPVVVYELHGQTPPLAEWRGYGTLSWTDQSAAPTVITAAERPLLTFGDAFTGIGGGLLWLEANDYAPYPILVSSTVIPLPIPRTSVVVIASSQPFQDFGWSVVLKVGVTLFFIR